MRILLINQFFWPELAATSVLLTDFVRFLSAQGYEVTVVCGATKYAGAEVTPRPDVEIITVPALKFGRSRTGRTFSYLSFLGAAFVKVILARRPDVIITMTTPPLTSLIGACLKKFSGIKHHVWEMDMYPDVAVDLGMVSPRSPFAFVVGQLADWGRRNADLVIALGECMKSRLVSRGVPEGKIRIAGNWADGEMFKPVEKPAYSEQLTIAYTGNLGMGHDVDTLFQALLDVRSDRRIRFLFVGGGERMKELQAFCEHNHLENVTFKPYVTRERLNEVMETVDIGLVTQNPDCVGSIVPSKFYSLAAVALPVLYIGAGHATPARLIDEFQCGWVVPVGRSKMLSSLLTRLADDRSQVRRSGEAALKTFRQLWDRPIAVQRLAEVLDLKIQSPGKVEKQTEAAAGLTTS